MDGVDCNVIALEPGIVRGLLTEDTCCWCLGICQTVNPGGSKEVPGEEDVTNDNDAECGRWSSDAVGLIVLVYCKCGWFTTSFTIEGGSVRCVIAATAAAADDLIALLRSVGCWC